MVDRNLAEPIQKKLFIVKGINEWLKGMNSDIPIDCIINDQIVTNSSKAYINLVMKIFRYKRIY